MSKKKKGQTSYPYGANYVCPSNIGEARQSLMGDVATLAGSAMAVKLLPALLAGGKDVLKNEVSKMTISDAAFKKGMIPQLTRSGIKNWKHLRPWKAFTPKMLKTGPTPASAAGTVATAGLTIKQLRDKFKK